MTRQGSRLGKLYEGLTGAEKAALVFSSAARLDTAEADRIEASVPLKIYRMADAEYRERLHRLGVLAFFFGNRYWREFARVAAAAGLMSHAWQNENDDMAAEACEVYFQAQGRMLALDEALRATCEANRLDIEAVWTLADVSGPYQAIGDVTVDVAFTNEMRGLLDKLAA